MTESGEQPNAEQEPTASSPLAPPQGAPYVGTPMPPPGYVQYPHQSYPQPMYQPYLQPMYMPPPMQYGYPRDHPKAGLAFGLGLGGLIGGFLSLGLGFALGPFAWYLGQQAMKQIRQSNGIYHRDGNATAGMVMGIIATVLLILAIVIWAIGLSGGFDTNTDTGSVAT